MSPTTILRVDDGPTNLFPLNDLLRSGCLVRAADYGTKPCKAAMVLAKGIAGASAVVVIAERDLDCGGAKPLAGPP